MPIESDMTEKKIRRELEWANEEIEKLWECVRAADSLLGEDADGRDCSRCKAYAAARKQVKV